MGEKIYKRETAKDYLLDRKRFGHLISGWRCPICGKVNAPHIAECSCNKEISTVTYSLDKLLQHLEMDEYQNGFKDMLSFWNEFGGKGVPNYRMRAYAKYAKKKSSKSKTNENSKAFVVHHEEFTSHGRRYIYDLYSDGSTRFVGFDLDK